MNSKEFSVVRILYLKSSELIIQKRILFEFLQMFLEPKWEKNL